MPRRPTLGLERRLLAAGAGIVVGLDEVGRGALAGPVAVGAVALTARCVRRAPVGIRDSKDLSESARAALAGPIAQWSAASAVGVAGADEIDAWGLTAALRMAAWRALGSLPGLPTANGRRCLDVVLLDGNHNYLVDPHHRGVPVSSSAHVDPDVGIDVRIVRTEIQADRKRVSVAAASILAKTTRDALMVDLAGDDDRYGWSRNKGYAAPAHRAALARWGPTPNHRLSWRTTVTP